MTSARITVGLVAAVFIVTAGRLASQHEGHQMASQPLPPGCQEGAQQAVSVIDHMKMTLESARQTNSPSAMRAAVEGVQAALTRVQSQLASCRAASPDQTGPTTTTSPAAPMTPVDHSKMDHAMPMPPAAPAEANDPVCGMQVDTRNALKVTHKGTAYYFCSEPDRQAFVTDPAKYLNQQPK